MLAAGRVWGDDEFWMSFLIAGIGWVLLLVSISVTGFIFYQQQKTAINNRREEDERRDGD